MKLSVLHDRDGNIVSLVAYPEDVPPAYLEPRHGEFLAELDDPDLRIDMGEEAVVARLDDLTRNYRVVNAGRPALGKR